MGDEWRAGERLLGAFRPVEPYFRRSSERALDGGISTGEHLTQATTGKPVRATLDKLDLPPDDVADPRIEYATPRTKAGGIAPLFDGVPTRAQVSQGALGNCGIVAMIGSVAGHHPNLIESAIREEGDGFLVTLHETQLAHNRVQPTGRTFDLKVTGDVPVHSGSHTSVYMDASRNGSRWASVMEKALAGADQAWPLNRYQNAVAHGYARLELVPRGERIEVLTQITGRPAILRPFAAGNGLHMAFDFKDQIADGKPVIVSLFHSSGSKHAYEVVAVDNNGTLALHNPWGFNHPPPMSPQRFLQAVAPPMRYATIL